MQDATRPVVLAEPAARAEVVVDSLAYVDELNEGLRSQVDALILEEMGTFKAPDYLSSSYIAPQPTVLSPSLEADVNRVGEGQLPSAAPTCTWAFPKTPANDANEEDWIAAIELAKVAVEAQTVRAINVDLMSQYGVPVWKEHVTQLEKILTAVQHRKHSAAAAGEDVNRLRKAAQDAVLQRMRALQRKHNELLAGTTDLELACADAEREVLRLHSAVAQLG